MFTAQQPQLEHDSILSVLAIEFSTLLRMQLKRTIEVKPISTRLEVDMPIYEFKCLDCGKTFTLPLTVKDFEKNKYQCPSCKKKNLEELFTSVNIVTGKKS